MELGFLGACALFGLLFNVVDAKVLEASLPEHAGSQYQQELGRQKFAGYRDELRVLQETIAALKNRDEELAQANKELVQVVKAIVDENIATSKTVEKLVNNNEMFKKDFKMLKQNNEMLKKDTEILKIDNDMLKKTVEELENKLESDNRENTSNRIRKSKHPSSQIRRNTWQNGKQRRLLLDAPMTTPQATSPIVATQPRPAFTARLSTQATELGKQQTIVFDNTLTNIGQAYSPISGIFTAPTDGAYWFFASILSETNSRVQTEIVVNNSPMVFMYSFDSAHEQGTNGAVLQLQQGDMVWVRLRNNLGTEIHGSHWSTFSGFQIA